MDKYDKAIGYLTEHPEEIHAAWLSPGKHLAGCLFQYASPTGAYVAAWNGADYCGCLTMIRNNAVPFFGAAYTEELTEAIRNDLSIPARSDEITVHHLPIFAKWQRRLDYEIRGKERKVEQQAEQVTA